VIGTAGAMLAQFSAGVPSSSSRSGMLKDLKDNLTAINSNICNERRHSAYDYVASAISTSPPRIDTNITRYMADILTGTRYSLYGDVYKRGLNNSDLPDFSKIKTDARDKMLRQYIVTTSALDDGKIKAIRGFGNRVETQDAIELIGGQDKLNLGPYELVANQLLTVLTEMGCKIDPDAKEIENSLSQGGNFDTKVTRFDSSTLFTAGPPTKWMRMMNDQLVLVKPDFSNQYYLSQGSLNEITRVSIQRKDLESAEISGNRVFSTKFIRFEAHGQKSEGFITVDAPSNFEIIYRVTPSESFWSGLPKPS
jgi:hypothetical protein